MEIPRTRRTTSAPVGKDFQSTEETAKEAETSSGIKKICEPALMNAFEQTHEEFAETPKPEVNGTPDKEGKQKLKLINMLLIQFAGFIALFGSAALAHVGKINWSSSNDIDFLVRPKMTRKIISYLSMFGTIESIEENGTSGSVDRSTTCQKVTKVIFSRGKGTIFEDDCDGSFTQISFDIVEIPHRAKFTEAVKTMKPHTESWLVRYSEVEEELIYSKVPVEQRTIDITCLDDVIFLIKGCKYLINPEYKGLLCFEIPLGLKLKYGYFKHIQFAVPHDEKCMICQEDFLPNEPVMVPKCGCRNGHMMHCKCCIQFILGRAQGFRRLLTQSGIPFPCDGKCPYCCYHLILEDPGDVNKIFTRSPSGDFMASEDYMCKMFIDPLFY